MTTKTTDWIEVARTGRFTDMSGRAVTITASTLRALAATDLAGYQAPLVFGHPKTNDPAYGWVDQLKVQGDRLLAKFREVPDQVKDLVRAGRFKNVSIRATPKMDRLVHVGLLGAVPPAIDGLKPVEFATDPRDPDHVIDFADPATEAAAQDTPITEENSMDIETLKKQLEEMKAALAAKEEELKKAQEDLAAEQADFAAYKAEKTSKDREARATALVRDGKVMPGEKARVLQFAAALSKDDEQLDFAKPDGSTEKVSAEEMFWRQLEGRKEGGTGLFMEFAAAEGGHQAEEDDTPVNVTSKF